MSCVINSFTGEQHGPEEEQNQVKDGADILSLIVPCIVDVMLENSELNGGNILSGR